MTVRRLSRGVLGVCVAVVGCAIMSSSAYASFGFESVEASFNRAPVAGVEQPDFQAGSHPYQLAMNFTFKGGAVKALHIELPRGVVGNPNAVPQCPMAAFTGGGIFGGNCPADTQIGTASVGFGGVFPLYNLVPPSGIAGQFGMIYGTPIIMNAVIRSGSDYGLNVEMPAIPDEFPVEVVSVDLWGVPANHGGAAPAEPFLTMPTSCSQPLTTTVAAYSWEEPEARVEKSVTTKAPNGAPGDLSGCDRLDFSPTIAVQPESSAADSPSGLSINMSIPYNNDPAGLAEASAKNISMAFPTGLSINPATGAGLTGCSPAQIGIGEASKPGCPNTSKMGVMEIETPLLSGSMQGSIYLAQPAESQFNGVENVYLAGEKDGLIIKLTGQLSTQPGSGQLTLTLNNLPEFPLNNFKLELFGGPRATVATPPSCGIFTATATLTPYSAPESGAPAMPSSSFAINEGCGGGFAPSFAAGATSSAAGRSTGFALQLARADGQQYIQNFNAVLPAGLVANLSTIPPCGEAQAAAGTCPASSEVGTVTIAAGAGSEPNYLSGPVFFTGPYGGAPFGMAMVIRASAGPFTLGSVIVRGKITMDFAKSRLTIVTDSFPKSLQGIPLRIKNLSLNINRPGFMVNPTNCAPERISGVVDSTEGASAAVSAPFQVAGCSTLPFAPKITFSTGGPASRARGMGLDLNMSFPTGLEANTHSIVMELPRPLRARLTTIQKACLAEVFATNPALCPASALVGSGTVKTTTLPTPLTGPVYIVSGSGVFPRMVMILQGDGVMAELSGISHVLKGGITSTTFEGIPDVPLSALTLSLPQGPHSALGSTINVCAHRPTIGYAITGYNGVRVKHTTKLTVLSGCGRGHLASLRDGSGRHGKR